MLEALTQRKMHSACLTLNSARSGWLMGFMECR